MILGEKAATTKKIEFIKNLLIKKKHAIQMGSGEEKQGKRWNGGGSGSCWWEGTEQREMKVCVWEND